MTTFSSALTRSVLVLNRNYQPVHVTTAKRAFSMLYQGVARALNDEYQLLDFKSWAELSAENDTNVVRTVSRVIRIPRVILLLAYDRLPRTQVRFSRYNIYSRDKATCQYCGRKRPTSELNLDHVVPRARGGLTTWENIVTSCIDCNLRKGGRTPDQAGLRLLKVPVRPRWSPMYRIPLAHVVHDAWKPFLNIIDLAYWNTELDHD